MMNTPRILFATTVVLLMAACSSQPKEAAPETVAAPAVESAPAPAPTVEGPTTDIQACEGKAARDACSYKTDKGEVKGACVRSESMTLQCLPKKSKKK